MEGYVYLMRAENGLYKIGGTYRDPLLRLASIKSHSPVAIELVRFIKFDDWRAVERKLHRIHESKRRHGEWFDLSQSDVGRFEEDAYTSMPGECSCDILTPQRIFSLRQALRWNRTALAYHLDVSEQTVVFWETARRHPKYEHMVKLNELAKKNGIDIDSLEEGKPFSPAKVG